MVRGSSPLLLLVVIKRVSTIQLFVRELVLLFYLPHRRRQLMMLKIVSKLHSLHVL